MHWAAHNHTEIEIIYERSDSEKENMDLTSWEGEEVKKSDIKIAKNYLTKE